MSKPKKKLEAEVRPTLHVRMEAEVARQIRQHSRSSMKAEVCGVLIGREEANTTTVMASIPGANAAQGGAHVTFTQDTWEHIYQVKDKKFPDERIVGWYHSHPGFGVFLSDHDLFIQQNFFASPQQIAWVYDPHSDEEGCFGWHNGSIGKVSNVAISYERPVGEVVAIDEAEDAVVRVGRAAEDGPSPLRPWLNGAIYVLLFMLGGVAMFMYLDWKAHILPRKLNGMEASYLVADQKIVPLPGEVALRVLLILEQAHRDYSEQMRRQRMLPPPVGGEPARSGPAAPQGGVDGTKK